MNRVSALVVCAASLGGIAISDGCVPQRSAPSARTATAPRPAPVPDRPKTGFAEPINTSFEGVTCFRGNVKRNYSGEGPVPTGHVQVLWRAEIGGNPGGGGWSGVGWTGQPLIVNWPEEVRRHMNFYDPPGPSLELIVGALDGQVHFFDAETGSRSRPPLAMPARNPIKGTVTIDPRGYPILYVGCGLNRAKAAYRAFSLTDFKELLALPGIDPSAPRRWPAFDSNGLVIDDTLYLVGENGLFYKVRLNAAWKPDVGRVGLDPEVQKVRFSKDGAESSIAVYQGNAYWGDTGGNLWRASLENPTDVQAIRALGDDSDSSVTFDDDGAFYVGIELDHRRKRPGTGVLYKLSAPDARLVWRYEFPAETYYGESRLHAINGGVVSSAAVWPEGNLVFITTAHSPTLYRGDLVALDRKTGKPKWKKALKGFTWSSPVCIGGTVVACDTTGAVTVLDAKTGKSLLTDSRGESVESLDCGAAIESSPIVWKGRIYVGIRGGGLLCLGTR